jgi:hypothetical protein
MNLRDDEFLRKLERPFTSQNGSHLIRPREIIAVEVPAVAAHVGDPLGLGQRRLTAAEGCFYPLSLSDLPVQFLVGTLQVRRAFPDEILEMVSVPLQLHLRPHPLDDRPCALGKQRELLDVRFFVLGGSISDADQRHNLVVFQDRHDGLADDRHVPVRQSLPVSQTRVIVVNDRALLTQCIQPHAAPLNRIAAIHVADFAACERLGRPGEQPHDISGRRPQNGGIRPRFP